MKNGWIAATVCVIGCGFSVSQYFAIRSENQRLQLVNSIYHAEHRILKDEIYEYEQKPTYENGYKDALIRVGGPNTPSAYQDGWDDAMKVVAEGGYANGYHAAIQQFGYQKPDASRWLIAEANIVKDVPKTEPLKDTPAPKTEEKK